MDVLAHPDPIVLENALLDRVGALRRGTLDPVLVIVPTERLAAHVRRRVAQRLGACLGLEVAHHRALVLDVLGRHPRTGRLASSDMLGRLLARVCARRPANLWSAFLDRRPGTLRALLATITDLREAGVSSDALHAAARERGTEGELALADLYEAYVGALEGCASRGFLDEAGLIAAALPHLPEYARRFRAVLHHGAYELTGVHLDLVRAFDAASPLTFLMPLDPGAPATRFAERFAAFLLPPGAAPMRLPDTQGSVLADRLRALYREEARPPAAPEDRVLVRHSQGAVSEFHVAARSALAAVAAGTPPMEIAVVAPSLAEDAGALEGVLDDECLPWASSASAPLRRDPAVHDLVLLLRTVADDFPRAPVAELLRSPRLRWGVPGHHADAWSRQARLLRGLTEWTEDLPAWAAIPRLRDEMTEEESAREQARAAWRTETARAIGQALAAVADHLRPRQARRWEEHAKQILALVLSLLPSAAGEPGPALQAFLEQLREMARLDAFLGDDAPVVLGEAVAWLEQAVDHARLPVRPGDDGGLRVLDAKQARGLTFDRLLLTGMHEGSFPRRVPADPVLSDATRARLREATGRPVPVKADAEEEDRLLLLLLLGSARERLEISWQRADDAGRARSPSPALREVARVTLGRPELGSLERLAAAIPAHPAASIEQLASSTGLLHHDEALLRLAFHSRGPRALAMTLSAGGAMALVGVQASGPGPLTGPDGRGKDASAPHAGSGRSGSSPRGRGVVPGQVAFHFEAEGLAEPNRVLGPGIAAATRIASTSSAPLVDVSTALGPGLRLLEAIESSDLGGGAFDARIGPAARVEAVSVTKLDTLGRCPLQYFFQNVLQVRVMDDEVSADAIAVAEMGGAVHGLLESLYRTLMEEELLGPGRSARARARAHALLPVVWERTVEPIARQVSRRLPVLWALLSERWQQALATFLDEDLEAMEQDGLWPEGLEVVREGAVAARRGPGLLVRARFDRVLSGRGRRRIGDYKTSGRLAKHGDVARMLKGHKLQVPVYALLEGVAVELLQVGPDLAGAPLAERRLRKEGFSSEEEEGLRETLGVLRSLLEGGSYPLVAGDHCAWCDYRTACRHNHPATLDREADAPDTADFRDVQRKTAKEKPTLRQVRGQGREDEEA